MTTERQVDRAVRVFVPAKSYRELLSGGGSAVTDLVIKLNTREVVDLLFFEGLIERDDQLLVSFVPVTSLKENSSRRPMKFIEVLKNERGYVVDALIQWLDFDLHPVYYN